MTRAGGNGNGKKRGKNGDLYQLSATEKDDIESIILSGGADEQVMQKYPLTKMQLAARKAVLIRKLRKNGEDNSNGNDKNGREEILKRDSYTCQYPTNETICGKTREENEKDSGHDLHVHHIDYNEKNNDSRNRISLCTSHHAMTNTIQHAGEMRKALEARVCELCEDEKGVVNKIFRKIKGIFSFLSRQ